MSWDKKISGFFEFAILAAAAAALVVFSRGAGDSAREGLLLCGNTVIPSLFPFFVISSLAVELGAAQYVGFIFEPVMHRLFNVGGACSPAFVLGLIGGYPIGAKTAVALYQKNLCSKTEAERLLAFCNNSGPSFILGVAAAGIFGDPRLGLILYPAHIAAAVTVGIIFGFYKRSQKPRQALRSADPQTCRRAAGDAFILSVRSALDSALNICSFVIIFSVIIKMLYIFNIIPAAAGLLRYPLSLFGFSESDARLICTGFFEITSGLWSVSKSQSALSARLILASFMLGWGGISVHCQVMSFTRSSGLSIKPYFAGKLLSAVFSAVYCSLLCRIALPESPAFAQTAKTAVIPVFCSFYKIFAGSFVSCVLIWNILVLLALALRKINHILQK